MLVFYSKVFPVNKPFFLVWLTSLGVFVLVVVSLGRVTCMIKNIFPYLRKKREEERKDFFLWKRTDRSTQKKRHPWNYSFWETVKLSINNLPSIKEEGKKNPKSFSKSELRLLPVTFLRNFVFTVFKKLVLKYQTPCSPPPKKTLTKKQT